MECFLLRVFAVFPSWFLLPYYPYYFRKISPKRILISLFCSFCSAFSCALDSAHTLLHLLLPLLYHVSRTDLERMEIPDLTYLLLLLTAWISDIRMSLYGILFVLPLLPFCLMGWLGFGDFKYLICISLIAGMHTPWITLCASSGFLLWNSIRKGTAHQTVPFAPWISISFSVFLAQI